MRKQRAFRTLTDGEVDQIAEWLRREDYDVVLERVRKARPEGLGLNISRSPLERLFAKTNVVKKINEHLESGEKLTVSGLEAITNGEATTTEAVHEAILEGTHALAKDEENSATQLLALQRLADFPDRVALREERLQLEREREQRRKELQAHRIAMDLRREERAERRELRCAAMDAQKVARDCEESARATQRLEFCGKRLRLAMKSLAFRRRQHRDRMVLARERVALAREKNESDSRRATNPSAKQADHLGPIATDWKGVGERVCKLFGITPEEEARRAELHKTWKDLHARPGIPEEINPVDD
jgi:hypothetical protein